jgi:O-antigen/teichoic acid export membrane protein
MRRPADTGRRATDATIGLGTPRMGLRDVFLTAITLSPGVPTAKCERGAHRFALSLMQMPEAAQATPQKTGSVLRNTLILVGAQVLGIPLSIFVNAVMGRQLGPRAFGFLNLGINLCGFAFMFVEWGHGGVLPREIAQDPRRSGVLLGSSIVSRIGLSLIASMCLALLSWLLYPLFFLPVLGMLALQALFAAVSSAYQDSARGFERTDVTAIGRIGGQVLNAAFVLPVLFLGGGLLPVMTAATVASFLILPLITTYTHRIGVGRPTFDRRELTFLARSGWAFLVSTSAMTALGFVDTIALSKLATPEVFGWNAAAQKLVGTLLVPSTALIASLYPTLSRLIVEDKERYKVTLRRSITATGLLAIPLALGCALYSDLGVSLYGRGGYAPAGQNLIVMSGMVLLVYFSMPLSSALLASGRHVAWASAQFGCVALRIVLDLLLIPWFQVHFGNGGLGVCVSSVLCEVVLVGVAAYMIPDGVIDRTLAKVMGKGLLAGMAMAAAALGLRSISSWLAAPITAVVYFGALYLVGGIDTAQISRLTFGIRNRFTRARAG